MRPRPPVVVIGIAAACLVAVTIGASRPFDGVAEHDPLVRGLDHWDSAWYLGIASNGYWYRPGEQSPVAFFPGYPLAIRAASLSGVDLRVAAVALSLACGLAAVMLFRRWVQAVKPEAARDATWLLALYPFAFYLYGVIYADAFFLVFAVGAFLALERDRPWLAALLGAVATFSRPAAPAIVIGLLLRSLERREKIRPVDFVPALAGCGLAAYMAFLGISFGDPLAFAHVQAAPGWDQAPGWHTWLKVAWFETMFPRVAPLVAVRLGGHALVTLGALALVIPTWRRLGRAHGAYVLVAVGLPALSSHDFQGLGRYALAAFPLFATVALLLHERPRVRAVWLAASAVLLLVLAAGFGAGGYIA
jgi:hypothetical protein